MLLLLPFLTLRDDGRGENNDFDVAERGVPRVKEVDVGMDTSMPCSPTTSSSSLLLLLLLLLFMM